MKELFSLRTVRKKILMLSKLAGAVLIFVLAAVAVGLIIFIPKIAASV